ncbi:SNF2 family N-terminal domain-containing protein [Hypoxylon fuscum]|nr:SNF2 family N-terminal domain-containing protein [Hypoxylon fuscum]
MNSGRPSQELVPVVGNLFRTARELFQEFQNNATNWDEYRPQLPPPSQSLQSSQPSQSAQHPSQFMQQPLPSRQLAPTARRSPREYDGGDDGWGGADENVDGAVLNQGRQKSEDLKEKDIQGLLKMPEIDIPPEQRLKTPVGMACTLMDHQRVCLTWLVKQEKDPHKKGGLLADTMGLGKTIQALALILERPSTDRFHKTTLIVCPVSLLKQWEREIQTKIKPQYMLKTLIFHGQGKRGMTVTRLLTYDVVLTTYGTVTWENKNLQDNTKKPVFILAKDAFFHRVILDEAHNIKNRSSKSSIASTKIKASYRLCMTGTPFMNRTEEIFSLIRFLRIKPYNQWDTFRDSFNKPLASWDGDERGDAIRRLQTLFRSITLRRTKTSQLDGQPILRLPALIKTEAMTEFNKDQRDFYEALEHQQQLEVNEFIKAGTVMKKYSYILVLLLRLRQACCHPHLIKDHGIPEGAELSADEMCTLAAKLRRNIVAKLKEQTQFECPICNATTPSPLIISPCGHPICSGCFSVMMEGRSPNTEDEKPCPHAGCKAKIDPKKVICHCFFLQVHCPEKLKAEAKEDDLDDLDDLDDESDESDGFESLDDDDDADARGNLKGFVVSESEDEDEDESEDEDEDDEEGEEGDEEDSEEADDGGSSGKGKSEKLSEPWKDVSEHKEATKEKLEEDSDDDSMASLEEIWNRVQAMKSIGKEKEKPEKSTKRKATPDSTSDIEESAETKPSAKGKRKRANDKKTAKARKRSKRDDGPSKKRRRGKKKEFLSLAALKKASGNNPIAKAKYLKRLRDAYVPSAKINKTMEILNAVREKNPNEKTLIFSLWTSFLDLLEIPMQDQAFNYARYDGSMATQDRDDAVNSFMRKPDIQVLMVSLTAGNAGLNLTAATHVIILEPFWNPFVEEQAIDRAHRIGQKNDVTVHRVLIENTVEDRIRKLQDQKRHLVESALSEEGAQGVGRLTVSQLKGLFGMK